MYFYLGKKKNGRAEEIVVFDECKMYFYLGKEKRERAEKLLSLVECMKREGQNDIFVSRKSDGAAGGQNSVK